MHLPFAPPALIVHCDWGTAPNKRWMARATYADGHYTAHLPEPVGDESRLVQQVQEHYSKQGSALIGFDLPIGVPVAYANQVEQSPFHFLNFLSGLGQDDCKDFYSVANDLKNVSLRRPFYPDSPGQKGEKPQKPFLDRLNIQNANDLRRECERHQPGRGAACPLFWTVGGNQVGKSAILGWKNVIQPALLAEQISIWPFHGQLGRLLRPGKIVVAETYPTQYHERLFDRTFQGKRLRSRRKAVGQQWINRANDWGILLDEALKEAILDGFPMQKSLETTQTGKPEKEDNNDDAFDAAIGLFGMIDALHNWSPASEPSDPTIRNIEGWILGQPIPPGAHSPA